MRPPSGHDNRPVCIRLPLDRMWKSVADYCTNVAAHGDGRPPSIPMGSHGASFAGNSIDPNHAAVNAANSVPFLVPLQRLYCLVWMFAVDSMDVALASCAGLGHCPTVIGFDGATMAD